MIRYINKTEVPTDIDLPTLTTKEKTYLDKNLHLIRSGGLGLAGLPFELTQSQLDNYLLYYKYYPNYQEGIV